MRLDLHQRVALWWLFTASLVFEPVMNESPRPDAGAFLGRGVVIVTLCIAACPLFLRLRAFRRLFCWTDSLSPAQRAALADRNLRRYYDAAATDGYVARVKPYLLRLAAVNLVLMVLSLAEGDGAVSVFATWYPLGAMLLATASLPWQSYSRRRQ